MAWNTHPTVVTGQTWSASNHNTYVKDNLDTLFPYTAALQVAYANSTNTLATATSTAALLVLRSNSSNTGLEFGLPFVVYKRQGASSANWYTTSTTSVSNYTPSNPIIQTGVFALSTSNTSVTFPVAFSSVPIVLFGIEIPSTSYNVTLNTVSTSAFSLAISSTGFTINTSWIAMGDL